MQQRDIFDSPETAKARAIDLVEKNADARWLAAALDVVRKLAARGDNFTTDDVWAALAASSWLSGKGPRERRAMGAVMRRAMTLKIARPLNALKNSESTVNHGRALRVWGTW